MRTVTIGDIGKIVTGKTPSTSNSEHFIGDIPFVTPLDLQSGKYIKSTARHVSELCKKDMSKQIVPPKSICVSCIGSILGHVSMTTDYSLTNQQVNTIIPNDDYDSNYVYYLMASLKPVFQSFELSGSAVPIINKQTFSSIEVDVHDLLDQRSIGAFLSSFDYQISLLSEINDNLSCLYDSIFNHYFGMNKISDGSVSYETRFYDILVESKEKDVSKKMPEYSVTNTGIKPRSNTFKKNLSEKTINKVVRKGNLVIGMSRTILNWGFMKDVDGSVRPAYSVFILKDGIDPAYVEGYINNNIQYFYEILKPSTREGQSLDKGALMDRVLIYPNQYEIIEFHKHTDHIIQKIATNIDEITRLMSIRDILLQKLLSGEIDISTLDLPIKNSFGGESL